MKNVKIENSTSIICACKNRSNALNVSLQSWIKHPEILEIIIVDWSSDESLEYLKKFDDRIKIITVSNEKYFNMPQPLNLAASIASGNKLLIMSVDYIFNPYDEFSFFKKYDVSEDCFLCGEIESQDSLITNPLFKYLRGILYVTKDNFIKIGGYNENYGTYYGNDDGEIEHRLELLGLKKNKLNLDYTIFHIPHTNKKRVENFEAYSTNEDIQNNIRNELSQYYSGNELEWQVEYLLAESHIFINMQQPLMDNYYFQSNIKWDIAQTEDQIYIAVKNVSGGNDK